MQTIYGLNYKYCIQINCLQTKLSMNLQDRILALLGLVIVCGFGYSVDMPQALQAPLRQDPYSLNSLQINFLYFAAFIPVMLTDIPIGIFLDKYPLQRSVLVIATSSFVSQIIIAMLFDFRPEGYLIGVYLMRAIGGMAGSAAYTMQGFLFARYASQNYEIMMGFGMTIPLIFDSINVTISPYIFDRTKSISLPWYIASMVDFLAVIAAVTIAVMVTRKEKRMKDESLLKSQEGEEQQQQQQQFNASYLLKLPKQFWILLVTVFFYEMSTLIFENLNDLLVNRFEIAYTTAANLSLIPYLLGAVLAIVCGKLVGSNIKKIRRTIILIVPLLLLVGLIALYSLPNCTVDNINPIHYVVIVFFLVLLSCMVGSIFSVVASSLSLLVDKKRLGTAWGVCGMAIGLSQSIVPIVNGLIQKEDNLPNSYTNLNLFFIVQCTVSVALGIWIYFGSFEMIDITFFQSSQKGSTIEETSIQRVKEQI